MNYYDLARILPNEFRRQLLDANAIYKAVVREGDAHMKMLVILWNNYYNPGEDVKIDNPCLKCLTDILDKFKIMEPYLIQLEKEYNLLEA